MYAPEPNEDPTLEKEIISLNDRLHRMATGSEAADDDPPTIDVGEITAVSDIRRLAEDYGLRPAASASASDPPIVQQTLLLPIPVQRGRSALEKSLLVTALALTAAILLLAVLAVV